MGLTGIGIAGVHVWQSLRRDPTLFSVTQATLTRWRATGGAASQPYLAQWQALLDDGMEACLRVSAKIRARLPARVSARAPSGDAAS